VDNVHIGRAVAEYFFERGYRQFAAYRLKTERFFSGRLRNFVSTCPSLWLPAYR
jgi:LacI family transcriptional regulator